MPAAFCRGGIFGDADRYVKRAVHIARPFFSTSHAFLEPIGGARSGLASRGATPQYSPALRWVTTGFGMGPGGATALWATSPPDWLRVMRLLDDWGRGILPGGNKAVLGGGWGGRDGDRPRP